MTQDESAIEAQQMSQDEEDEDDDEEEDRESESSHESHFEGANDENDDGIEVEEEEEEDDDDEDDEEEGEDEEDDDEDQFLQDPDEAIYRFPLGDNDDDLDLMIQYRDDLNHDLNLAQNHIEERMRVHLPLWSDMIHQANDHASVGAGALGAGNHVSPNHPLLMGRQATNAGAIDPIAGSRNRGLARQLQRGFRGVFQLGSSRNQNATAPIFQSFLGGNNPHAQEIISTSLRRGGPVFLDFGYAIMESFDNAVSDLDNGDLGSSGRDALNSIPTASHRWNEESRVIDGDSMHDCVTALKPSILEVVEANREEELVQRKAKKKKEQEEEEEKLKKKLEAERKAEAEKSESNESNEEIANSTPNDSTTAAQMADDLAAAISSHLSGRSLRPDEPQDQDQDQEVEDLPPPPPPFPTLPLPAANSTEAASNEAGALAPLSPLLQNRDVVMRSENTSPTLLPPTSDIESTAAEAVEAAAPVETRVETEEIHAEDSQPALSQNPSEASTVIEAVTTAAASLAESEGNDPGAGPSGTSTGPDYSSILGIDVRELPEGVDPSFLAALPEDMRMEVIEEQRRLQSIRQRAAQNVEAGVTEVNPEFLAALPPNIQEEVLAQQRIEQQRQAAQANPEAPVDPGEFLQTLPENLRQTILADMEESQIASLPADLAAEAQLRRREFEQQQRSRAHHMMHERFYGHSSSTLSSILRNSVNRMGSSYIVHGNRGGSDTWRHSFGARGPGGSGPSGLSGHAVSSLFSGIKVKGRQLLDQEGLSCLLIILFIDDPKIKTSLLHRYNLL